MKIAHPQYELFSYCFGLFVFSFWEPQTTTPKEKKTPIPTDPASAQIGRGGFTPQVGPFRLVCLSKRVSPFCWFQISEERQQGTVAILGGPPPKKNAIFRVYFKRHPYALDRFGSLGTCSLKGIILFYFYFQKANHGHQLTLQVDQEAYEESIRLPVPLSSLLGFPNNLQPAGRKTRVLFQSCGIPLWLQVAHPYPQGFFFKTCCPSGYKFS